MIAVAEHDALVDAFGQVRPGVAHVQPDEAAPGVGMGVAGHQEGMEDGHKGLRGQGRGPGVHHVVHTAAAGFGLRLRLGQQRLDEPLVVARRGGAGLLDQVVIRQREQRIHLDPSVQHRLPAQVFIDAPGARDHANVLRIQHVHRDGAGVDVEHAPGHRGARLEAAPFSRLLRDMTRDVQRTAQRRQRPAQAAQPKAVQQRVVVLPGVEVHQVRPGIVGDLGAGLAGQPEAHVVLALKHPLDVVHHLRLVVLEPGQQRHRLAGHDVLAGQLEGPRLRPIPLPLHRVGVGAVVRGDDAVAGGPAVLAPQVQPLAVAADGDARDVLRGDARPRQHVPDDAAVGVPHLLHVPLGPAGPRGEHPRLPARHADLAPRRVVDRGLRGRAAVVKAHVILHRQHLASPSFSQV